MKFRPLHDRVLVRRIEADEKTAGGIIIPETAQEKIQTRMKSPKPCSGACNPVPRDHTVCNLLNCSCLKQCEGCSIINASNTHSRDMGRSLSGSADHSWACCSLNQRLFSLLSGKPLCIQLWGKGMAQSRLWLQHAFFLSLPGSATLTISQLDKQSRDLLL